ncbi:flavin reductase [uncultured Coprobacter sp.]|jgi:hypothetical protein|uniref:flavin reductase family protein n=1 Tax=uncultured Coprobacter sp. TaxID=1720550 RepID=UPI00261E2CE8|nr:flavin reductase [uncultured Coprobacter sp.]
MSRINLGQRAGVTPTPVLLIGTYNEDGSANAMIATWGVTATWEVVELNLYKSRKTTDNIKREQAFTVSIVTRETLAQCDYLGTATGKKVHDKVKRCGLSPMKSPLVNAPYFRELPVTMECELLRVDPEEDEISERILGTVKNVSIDEQVLKEDKKTLDFSKLHPVCWDNFSNDYFAVGEKLGQWFTLGKVFK